MYRFSRRDFLPFGEDLARQNYGTDSIRQKFTGYEKDTETGLDFAEARYYNSAHGRFTAVDPLLASGKSVDPQTFNRYAYTMNNPLNLVDPTGMQSGQTLQTTCNIGDTGCKADGDLGIVVNIKMSGDLTPVEALSTSINRTLNDIETGVVKGVPNFFIGLANTATFIGSNTRNGMLMPGLMPSNPFEIERYNYDTLTQAKYGTAVEVGLSLAPSAAGAAIGGASSLSVVPRTSTLATSETGGLRVAFSVGEHLDEFSNATNSTNYFREFGASARFNEYKFYELAENANEINFNLRGISMRPGNPLSYYNWQKLGQPIQRSQGFSYTGFELDHFLSNPILRNKTNFYFFPE